MNKKYVVPIALITSMTILQSPAYSQLDMPQVGVVQKFGFQPNANPAPTRRGQPGLSDMMKAWEQETDPTKKRRLARQIQTRVGVAADGVIGQQTMRAIQQAGGQAGTSVVDFGGSQFRGNNPGQPAQGGFFGNLFAPRPAQPANPALGNKMREWDLEPDPNKKRMIAMEIQRDLGVKADGVIGSQTIQAVQQAGGMVQTAPGGGGFFGKRPAGAPPPAGGGFGFNPNPGQPAPGGSFGFNPNPNQPAPGGGGFFGKRPAGAPPPAGGGFGFNPNPNQPAPGGGGMMHGGGGMHGGMGDPGGGGMHGGMGDPGGGGMHGGLGDPGGGGMPGGGDPGPGGGGDPGGGPKN